MAITTWRTKNHRDRRHTNMLRMQLMDCLRVDLPDMPYEHRCYAAEKILGAQDRTRFEAESPVNSGRYELRIDAFVDGDVLSIWAAAQIVSGKWKWFFHPVTSYLNADGTNKEKCIELTRTVFAEVERIRTELEKQLPTKQLRGNK